MGKAAPSTCDFQAVQVLAARFKIKLVESRVEDPTWSPLFLQGPDALTKYFVRAERGQANAKCNYFGAREGRTRVKMHV